MSSDPPYSLLSATRPGAFTLAMQQASPHLRTDAEIRSAAANGTGRRAARRLAFAADLVSRACALAIGLAVVGLGLGMLPA